VWLGGLLLLAALLPAGAAPSAALVSGAASAQQAAGLRLASPFEVLAAAGRGSRLRWVVVRAGPPIGEVPIEVLRSLDGGQTWDAASVTLSTGMSLERFGFSTARDGRLVLGSDRDVNDRLTFESHDGGAHWSSPDAVSPIR
jgi:hypothetical protein